MKMSTKGRYALTIMANLAKNYKNNEFISLKDISEKENISLKYLEKIMINLNKQDYFITSRGSSGGYKLKYDPSKYKIGDILRCVEGDLAPVNCINNKEYCNKKEKCDTYDFWQGLYNEINNFVDSKTLNDYIKEE
ncbi:MAG: Rrf2 family transcriptional regulator [Bacilli bacterium]|nr:Rrf2 family transcriptional regulator [Bacilli bacterium]